MTRHRLATDKFHYRWDPQLSPVLEIESGDSVTIDVPILTEDQLLPGASPRAILDLDWARIHALVGPISIAGARKGDTLEIGIKELEPGPWGVSWIDPSYGLLRDEFDVPAIRFFDLIHNAPNVQFESGLRLPLAPFLGVMGVAPENGPITTFAPGSFGGNLDCKELTAGSRLFLPVFVEGARFSIGDGHALQGDGEMCSAIECAMTAHLDFHLHKRKTISAPRAETDSVVMTMGHGRSLEEAARHAAQEMVEYLGEALALSPPDAYVLCSLAGDLRVNQVVNGNPVVYGARVEVRKEILVPRAVDDCES